MIPGLGRSPGEGNCSPLPYSCWRIPQAEEPGKPVHGVTKSWTRLSTAPSNSEPQGTGAEDGYKQAHEKGKKEGPLGPWIEGGKHHWPPSEWAWQQPFNLHREQPICRLPFHLCFPSHCPKGNGVECEKCGQRWRCWARRGIIFTSLCGCGDGRGYQNRFWDQSVQVLLAKFINELSNISSEKWG